MSERKNFSMRMVTVILAVVVTVAFTPLFAGPAMAASKLKVSKTKVTVTVGTTSSSVSAKGLSAAKLKKVTWSSSNTAVANITKIKGKSIKIQGIKAGTAKVYAKYGKTKKTVKVTVAAAKPAEDNNPSVTGNYRTESYISGVLYQESAEVAAQYKQAFVLAKDTLDKAIAANGGKGEGLAIVTDIDATLLDDSCYFAGALLDSSRATPWNNDDWFGYYAAIASSQDAAVPGAIDFVQYAYSEGVEIYYITNRPFYELDLTCQQLIHAGFFKSDDADLQTVLTAKEKQLKEHYIDKLNEDNQKDLSLPADNDYDYDATKALAEQINSDGSGLEMGAGYFTCKEDPIVQVQGYDYSSDKSARRDNAAKAIAKKYEGGKVIFSMGDSINDHVSDTDSEDFSRKIGNVARTANVTKSDWNDKWGTQFIMMPNSAYGDWLKATWYKNKAGNALEQCSYIKTQLDAHAYKDNWYNGPSPTGPNVQ